MFGVIDTDFGVEEIDDGEFFFFFKDVEVCGYGEAVDDGAEWFHEIGAEIERVFGAVMPDAELGEVAGGGDFTIKASEQDGVAIV